MTFSPTGSQTGEMTVQGETTSIRLPLPGEHNFYNVAMASAVLRDIGLPLTVIKDRLQTFSGVPGRFEVYPFPRNVRVVVDYAHTLEAVESLLRTIQELDSHAQIIHTFGFQTKSGPNKWEKILETSAAKVKQVFLTTVDLNGMPSASLEEIYQNICQGYPDGHISIVMDRTQAISRAIESASPHSWVLVTGKGHEAYKDDFALGTHSDKETILYLQEQFKKRMGPVVNHGRTTNGT